LRVGKVYPGLREWACDLASSCEMTQATGNIHTTFNFRQSKTHTPPHWIQSPGDSEPCTVASFLLDDSTPHNLTLQKADVDSISD